MPGIIGALADSGTPLSILTKGTLLARDIPLLKHAAAQVPVGVGISLAMTDEHLSEAVEPGTPGPRARLKLVTRLREAGLPCGVMAMPILPWLSDSDEALDSLFGSLAAAGATGVTAGALYLKPGTREWFMQWIAREHPAARRKVPPAVRHGLLRLQGVPGLARPAASGTSRPGTASPARTASATATSTAIPQHRPAALIPGTRKPSTRPAASPRPAALAGARHGSHAAEAAQPTLF